jgi:hypothetical protein
MPADNSVTQDGESEKENENFLYVRKIIYRHFAMMTSRCTRIFETTQDVADRQ